MLVHANPLLTPEMWSTLIILPSIINWLHSNHIIIINIASEGSTCTRPLTLFIGFHAIHGTLRRLVRGQMYVHSFSKWGVGMLTASMDVPGQSGSVVHEEIVNIAGDIHVRTCTCMTDVHEQQSGNMYTEVFWVNAHGCSIKHDMPFQLNITSLFSCNMESLKTRIIPTCMEAYLGYKIVYPL